MKYCSLLIGCLISISVLGATSPVVQVVSYSRGSTGAYTMLGWGSGSIIDTAGHIVTNNHVVDDGHGGISDDFSICITESSERPPRCSYTASVVERDIARDIAVLRIDDHDVSGQKVSFSDLPTLPVDYDYVPEVGDTSIARGYPWVGANTITETQGIVSGTIQNNDATYIKTDTLIAGGNSGGPLIAGGSMVGVNTFLVGGFFDPALGYSLLIGEARDLITSAQKKAQLLQTTDTDFGAFIAKTMQFTEKKRVVDDLITIDLLSDYTVIGYRPGEYLALQKTHQDLTSIVTLEISHEVVSPLQDDAALLEHLADGQTGYKLTDVRIGGHTWKRLDTKNFDTSKLQTDYQYALVVDQKHLIVMNMSTPQPTRDTYERIQQNITAFLAHISFPPVFTFRSRDVLMFADTQSGIRVGAFSILADAYQSQTVLQPLIYSTSRSLLAHSQQDMIDMQVLFMKNTFEYEDFSRDQWVQFLEEFAGEKPQSVLYKGHEGFLVCRDTYDYETGEPRVSCEVVMIIGADRDIVSFSLQTAPEQVGQYRSLIPHMMDRILIVPDVGETAFDLSASHTLPYADIASQSSEYQDMLAQLLDLGILTERPRWSGDTAYTWRDYIRLYVWAVYHRRLEDRLDPSDTESPTVRSIIDRMPVRLDSYATPYETYQVNALLRLFVSGGSLSSYDRYTLDEFLVGDDTSPEWRRIRAFETAYFGDTESSEYISTPTYKPHKVTLYVPEQGIRQYARSELPAVVFGSCEESPIRQFSADCMDYFDHPSSFASPVLTKGEAITVIYPFVREGIWE